MLDNSRITPSFVWASVLVLLLWCGYQSAIADETTDPVMPEDVNTPQDIDDTKDPEYSEDFGQPEPDSESKPVGARPRRQARSDFPLFEDFSIKDPNGTDFLPIIKSQTRWSFALGKLALLIVVVAFWFRVQSLRTVDEDDEDFESEFWTTTLFYSGLAGAIALLLIPAALIGALISVGALVIPFWRYQRWRNRRVMPPATLLDWKHLWTRRVVTRKEKHVAPVELPTAETIGTSGAVIKLIERTPNQPQTTKAGKNSAGFQTVLALIDHAASNRVTDLHINPKDEGVVVRHRIDGSLKTLATLPSELGLAVINVIKVLGNLSIADRRRSQDGSFRADVNGQRLSFRVSSQGIHSGEKLSLRVLDPAKNFATLSTLGMSEPTQQQFTEMLSKSNGVILFVGATGAGKSTTACASLQTIATDDRSIISIEDPIEYQIPSVDQIEVNERAGQTFDSALRAVLRQDADVIFIGEMRDDVTARTGCRAALTGQLVLGTMHSTDAVAGVVRLIELGINRQDVASSLRAVLAQTLVRKLCSDCRVSYQPDADTLERLGLADFEGELYQTPDPTTNSCLTCNGRGFFRRTALFELLEVTAEIRELIHNKASVTEIGKVARKNGMSTLANEGLRLVRDGVISVAELNRVSDGA